MQESTGNTQQTQNTSSWASYTLAAAFLPSFIPFPLLSLYTSDGGACFVSSTFSVNVINHHPFAICVWVWVFTILQHKKIHNIPRGKPHLQYLFSS